MSALKKSERLQKNRPEHQPMKPYTLLFTLMNPSGAVRPRNSSLTPELAQASGKISG